MTPYTPRHLDYNIRSISVSTARHQSIELSFPPGLRKVYSRNSYCTYPGARSLARRGRDTREARRPKALRYRADAHLFSRTTTLASRGSHISFGQRERGDVWFFAGASHSLIAASR